MTQRTSRSSLVPWFIPAGIYLLFLSGRFSVAFGGEEYTARSLLAPAVIFSVLLWVLALRDKGEFPAFGRLQKIVMLFLAYLLLSVSWAHEDARQAESIVGLAIVLMGVWGMSVAAAVDAQKVGAVLLWMMFLTGLVYLFGSFASGATSGIGRSVAFGGGPNVFVRIMVWGAISAMALFWLRKSWLLAVPLPLFILYSVLSGSRGGLLAAAVCAAVMAVLLLPRVKGRHLLLAAVVGAVAIVVVGRSEQARYILERRFDADLIVSTGYSGRAVLYEASMDLFRDSPVFGNGADSFYALASPRVYFPYPHNLVLEVAADAGMIGLVLLGLVLVAAAARLKGRRTRLGVLESALFSAALFTFLAAQFSGDFYDSRFLWLFLVALDPWWQEKDHHSQKSSKLGYERDRAPHTARAV